MERYSSDAKSNGDRPRLGAVSRNNRSRVSNGTRLLVGVDGRSREARRWRDLYREYLAETDGRHEQLCRQLASLIVQREALDARLANGEPIDPDVLVRLCGAIGRTLSRAGLAAGDDAREPYDATEDCIRRMDALP